MPRPFESKELAYPSGAGDAAFMGSYWGIDLLVGVPLIVDATPTNWKAFC